MRRLSSPWTFLPLAVLLSFSHPLCAIDIPLSVSAREGSPAAAVPVSGGVPFAEGVLTDPGQVRLLQGGREVPAQFRRAARWPDGSVRWLLVDFVSDLLTPPGATQFLLRTGTAPAPVTGITVNDQPSTLTLTTGAAVFTFTKSEFKPGGFPLEVTSGGGTYQAVPVSWVVEDPGPVKATVRVEGTWRNAGGSLGNEFVRFRARLVFHRGSARFHASVTFRNNGPFCWDVEGCTRQDGLVLSGVQLGAVLLPAGGSYVIGPGVEKTWEVEFPPSATPRLIDTRFTAEGTLASGSAAPQPLLLASPAYYASTGAWGRISLPVRGLPAERQADFDRFEKMQRAKVLRSEVEDPPNISGITLFGHLAQDVSSWNDYGDLRWAGNGCGTLSGNHYDWSYGMYLQLMRTGLLPFGDAARVFARHEIDFDIYHTGRDGAAFNYQKNWEDRPSHDTPDNCFGGGRPTHTWTQGYALHWLLTGDPRGRDGFDELQEGIRQYLYESFNEDGRVVTSEIRLQGWLTENLVARYRIEPDTVLTTTNWGTKTIPQAIKSVLEDVFSREAAAGAQGFVFDTDPGTGEPDRTRRAPLQHLYFLEPAMKAYLEVFKGRDPEYAGRLLGLIQRMTGYLMSVTYGGDMNAAGLYRPRQIPYLYQTTQPIPEQLQGQVAYALQAANAAGFLYSETGDRRYLNYARLAFQDYVRYFLAIPGDTWADPSLRSPTAYNTTVFDGTESKIHGWSSRYGQYFLSAEAEAAPVFFVPAVLSSAGRSGSFYTSEMTLTNLSSREASVFFEYTPFAGGGGGRSTVPERLGPGRQVAVPNVLPYLKQRGIPIPDSDPRAGTLRVTFEGIDSARDASVNLRTTTPVPPLAPIGRAGLSYAGLSPAELLSSPVYICGLRGTASDRSAVAVQNAGGPDDGDITLRISLINAAGVVETSLTQVLSPGGFAQPSLPEVSTSGEGYYARIERVAGIAGYFAYGVVNDNQNSDGSFFLPVPERNGSGATRLVLPAVVEAGIYSTEVTLTNTGSARKTLELLYSSPAIDGGGSRLTVELAPGEQRIVPGFVERLRESGSPAPGPPGPAFTGPVTISVPGGTVEGLAAGARTVNPDSGGVGQYSVAYGAVASGASATEAAWIFGLKQDPETRSNMAFVNTGEGSGDPVRLQVDLFDGTTGQPSGTTTVDLAPLQFLQLGKVLSRYAPGTSNGYAKVTRILGGAPFVTYGVVNDGEEPGDRSGDGAFVAMRLASSAK